MKYNFDEIINRADTNSVSFEGWKQYIFNASKDEVFPFPDSDYIRFWIADMDFATPPEILNAIRKRLDDKILGYTFIYDKMYNQVLVDWFKKRYDWKINIEDMVIAPGIVPALNRLVPLLTNIDESILIVTPSYAPFKTAAAYNSRKVVTSKLLYQSGRFLMDFEDIEQKITDKGNNIKLFILCNPHNPTGRVWTEEELLRLGNLCLQNDVWIISDEIHCDLLRRGKKHIAMAMLFPETDKIITCTAPSKTFNLAGNLMSHIFIPDSGIRRKWKNLYNDLLSPLSIVAAKAAYQECELWLEELITYLDDNFTRLEEMLKDRLPKAKFTVPEATYLAWINISEYLNDMPEKNNPALFFAKEAGVLVEDGKMFVDNGYGYIRLNIACPRAVLEAGIKRMARALYAH